MSTAGWEVTLHRSLVEPITIAGLPRNVALSLWTSTFAILLGAHQFWILPIGLILHAACAVATKSDPYIFEIFIRALKTQRRLEP